ncbi:MAG: class I SAM-dependent methyltransferase [Bacteroidota bacterium]
MQKDLFSAHAASYAKFRPSYPKPLIKDICEHASGRSQALDVGAGSGQVAELLADHFETVYGIDISTQQLAQSTEQPNVHYRVSSAERTPFASSSFDLVTAAQAYHWFDEAAFWQEVERIAKPGAVIGIWGYQLLRIDDKVDCIIDELYGATLGSKYWGPERRKVDEGYRFIQFQAEEITFPNHSMTWYWTKDDLLGYIATWSAVQKYLRETHKDPMEPLRAYLHSHWGSAERRQVRFPIFGRLGRIKQ